MIKKIFTVGVVVLTIFWAVGLAAFVPTAQATTFSSGDLIKASLPAVYYYGADGKRYVFPNEPTYKTWYADFSGVRTITDGELATIQIGGNVTDKPGVKLVKITTDPKVYAVAANGTLRWVTTASLAESLYGSNWGAMVLDVSDAFFVNYTIGAPINAVSDYSPSAATAAAQSINVDKGLAGATTTGGNLNVALASDTPASATIAAGAQANMTKIILSAGSAAVQVNSVYVTRSGLSSNDDILNIKLVGADGATVGSMASLGSNSKALVTFVPSLQLAANTTQTLYLRASIGVAAPSGNTVALSIAAASDVVLAAGTVTGAFPIAGNYMSIVFLAGLGSATVDKNSLPPDSKPDAGAKRVQVSQFEVQAGPNENLTVESLSLIEAGTASNGDYANIELYSLTEGRTLGTVAAWDANSRVVYGNLNIVIPKGSKHIFEVFTDVVSGSGNNLNVDVTDGTTDALVVVKGNTYGFYLTPAIGAGWDGKGTAQTVNTGILNITKDVSTPATGNITQASEQALTTWAFEVRGESAKITSMKVTFAGTIAQAAVINAKVVDETGNVVAGPKAITLGAGPTIAGDTVTFTETNIVPTGTHKFTLKVDVLSSAVNGTNISAGIVAPGTVGTGVGIDVQATGMNTRDGMNISSAAAGGNLQTILGVALNATTLTQPAARQVSRGTQNFVWATASLDATNSGEDVRISAVTVNDTHVGLSDFTEIQNLSIWADLTSASSDRGDAYETKVSNNEQPIVATATKAISLTQIITVPKGSFIKIAVVGSLATAATGTSNRINISAVTAAGKATGNTPVVVYSGLGQVMTNVGAGTLTTTVDASSPVKQILVSGQQKVTVANIKLAADNVENQDLDQMIVTDIGGAGLSGAILNGAITAISLTSSAITGIVSAAGTVTVTAPGHTIPAGVVLTGTISGAAYGTCNGTFALTRTGVNTLTYVAPALCVTSATAGTLTTDAVITSAGHGLATGDSVKLGGTDSTPAIDFGPYTITVLGANEFTVPVPAPITLVGTTGTWVKLNRGLGVGPVASAWYLYASARSDSGSTADPVAVAAGGAVANFQLADNVVTIPANGSVILTVKADVASVDGTTVINGENLQAEILGAGDVLVTGKSSGLQIAGLAGIASAAHVAYASRPTVSVNASSPSGNLVPSANSLLAIFNVAADSADDITFDGPALPNATGADYLTIQVASSCVGAGANAGIILKDKDGNVLDNATLAAADVCTPGAYTFLFAQRDLSISKGQTNKFYIYADTSGMVTNNNVQVYLDDASGVDMGWTINYDRGVGGADVPYTESDVIFRGGIYAYSLKV